MNKMLMLGIGALCVVGSIFVACGSGDVSAPSEQDEINAQMAATVYADDSTNGTSMEACLADAACAASLQTPVSSAVVSSSSEVVLSSSSVIVIGSSSSSTDVIPSSSSTSLSSAVVPSSSSLVTSSSSVVASSGSTTLTGTCAPVSATISKGESTKWTFTRLTPSGTSGIALQGSSTFTWTMPGSTEATATGTGLITTTGTYAASGSYTASVAVGDFAADCSALQVNGAAITGTCTADKTTADAYTSEVITWTVAATSTGANITGYTWTGATGTSATATLTASATAVGTTVTPTVSVTNDDNTVQQITCDGVEVIDSSAPEYVLDSVASYTVAAGTYSMQYACPANEYYQQPINISASGTWENFTASYSTNEKSGSLSSSPQYNITFADLFGSWSGSVPTEMISITVDHAVVIKCQ